MFNICMVEKGIDFALISFWAPPGLLRGRLGKSSHFVLISIVVAGYFIADFGLIKTQIR
jgi:hypothetical protein